MKGKMSRYMEKYGSHAKAMKVLSKEYKQKNKKKSVSVASSNRAKAHRRNKPRRS